MDEGTVGFVCVGMGGFESTVVVADVGFSVTVPDRADCVFDASIFGVPLLQVGGLTKLSIAGST